MDAVWALSNDSHDLREPRFARVVDLKGTAGDEAKVIDGEQKCLKDRFARVVERTVDKYVLTAETIRHASLSRQTLADDSGDRLFDCGHFDDGGRS